LGPTVVFIDAHHNLPDFSVLVMTFRTIYGPPNHRDTHDLRTNT